MIPPEHLDRYLSQVFPQTSSRHIHNDQMMPPLLLYPTSLPLYCSTVLSTASDISSNIALYNKLLQLILVKHVPCAPRLCHPVGIVSVVGSGNQSRTDLNILGKVEKLFSNTFLTHTRLLTQLIIRGSSPDQPETI